MIEYAINDLIQHMNRQPPAIMHEVSNVYGGTSQSRSGIERRIAEFSSAVDTWIEGLESDIKKIWSIYEGFSIEQRNVDQLAHVINAFEAELDTAAKDYKKYTKRHKKVLGQYREAPIAYRTYTANSSKRWMANLARWEVAKAEVILSIRALRAKYASDAASGPIFDDHKALGDYLRAATA